MNLGKLKTLLAECHIKETELKPFLARANPQYLISRAQEEIEKAETNTNPQVVDESLKLAIQLLNMARYKHKEASNGEGKKGNDKRNDASASGPEHGDGTRGNNQG